MPDVSHSSPDSAIRTPHSAIGSQPLPNSALRPPQSALASQPARLMEDILSSYEQRIEGVQSIFDTTRLVLANFQEGADQAREEQELIHRQLRDVLARNEHLRNKDYDLMIQRIVEPRREQEKEIRALLNEFLAEQQRLAASLKDCYGQIRDQLAQGNTRKILDLLKTIKELLAEQAQCKEELTSNLREAQADQQAAVRLVRQLLVKGNTLRIRDFKDMLAHIQNQGKERIARKFKRREEVRRMLAEFKQQRARDAEERQVAQMPGAVQWAALRQLQILDQGVDMQTKTA